MADIQNFVGFAQGERLIKEYFGFKMFSPVKARINLSVTSKRVVVYSSVKNFFVQDQASLFQQIAISEIRGLDIVQGTRYNFILLAGSVVALVAGIAASLAGSLLSTLPVIGSSIQMIGILLCIIGVIGIILFAIRPKKIFRFIIRGQAIDLNVGEFAQAKPVMAGGSDFPAMVEELGALIIQIQEGTV
ncbi:hypothetical protein [uncultured Methanoregula sp.]|uniref:hypothetical protein n=1 Tax=uncultured Methanoregula sp. TaxID=1005933 RepID=UPI002AAB2B1B|nr:hypothetical protein [uncultured Methanoregula sp.]